MAVPTSCEGSLDFIPGIAGPVEGAFAHGNETTSQQVMCLVESPGGTFISHKRKQFRNLRGSMLLRLVIVLVVTSSACTPIRPAVDTSENNRPEHEAAAKELRKLAEEGNVSAQNGLGLLYKVGTGVPQSYGQAKKWFEEAAKQGHAEAQVNLGKLYLHGEAPPQSTPMALFWFGRAADQGNVTACANLGEMYAQAQGVPQDFVQAYMWFLLAAGNGDESVAQRRDTLATKMTSVQIAEAQERAREWKPTSNSVTGKLITSDTVLTDSSHP